MSAGRVRVDAPRYASPQAWARLRAHLTAGEAVDVARDLVGYLVDAGVIDVSRPGALGSATGYMAAALWDHAWSDRRQA